LDLKIRVGRDVGKTAKANQMDLKKFLGIWRPHRSNRTWLKPTHLFHIYPTLTSARILGLNERYFVNSFSKLGLRSPASETINWDFSNVDPRLRLGKTRKGLKFLCLSLIRVLRTVLARALNCAVAENCIVVREVLLAGSKSLRARIAALSTRLLQLSKNFLK
jgi:hypothetical protein